MAVAVAMVVREDRDSMVGMVETVSTVVVMGELAVTVLAEGMEEIAVTEEMVSMVPAERGERAADLLVTGTVVMVGTAGTQKMETAVPVAMGVPPPGTGTEEMEVREGVRPTKTVAPAVMVATPAKTETGGTVVAVVVPKTEMVVMEVTVGTA